MEKFRGSNNQFEGQLPASLGFMPNMKFFYMNNNLFTGAAPLDLYRKWPLLSRSFLNDNKLSGSLPDDDSWDFGRLIVLRLGNNQITGKLPSSLGLATSLTSLAIENNAFTGAIPTEVGLLRE